MTEIKPEVIDIASLGDTPVITLNKTDAPSKKPPATMPTSGLEKPSANFGTGIELLMNDKRKNSGGDSSKSPTTDIDLGDLTALESELNGLSEDIGRKAPSKSGMFNKILGSSGGIKLNVSDGGSSLSGSGESQRQLRLVQKSELVRLQLTKREQRVQLRHGMVSVNSTTSPLILIRTFQRSQSLAKKRPFEKSSRFSANLRPSRRRGSNCLRNTRWNHHS